MSQIVVGVKALGPPHVLKLWLVLKFWERHMSQNCGWG